MSTETTQIREPRPHNPLRDAAAAWFADLVTCAAADGLGDLYIEVRAARTAPQILAWSRPLELEGYTALRTREVPAALAADPTLACESILVLVGLTIGSKEIQVAHRQMQLAGEVVEVEMVYTPSGHGGRLALHMTPSHRVVAAAS